MGTDSSKYSVNQRTNFAKELDIDVHKIKQCKHLKLDNDMQYIESDMDLELTKNNIKKLDRCRYIHTNYVYNTKNRIQLTFDDNTELIIALSDCGKYIGKPTRASAMGIWFCLIDSNNTIYQPFNYILT